MFDLKTYQKRTLKVLGSFLEQSRYNGPAAAFARSLAEQESPYQHIAYRTVPGLESVPYVCLRLPTGGGKTFLAAQSVGVAAKNYLEQDHPVVLWLVPTNAIREQTLEILKKPEHPCREALDAAFEGRVGVFDISDVDRIRPQDLTERVCIIVGTLATLRVEKTEGRRIYDHNENFEPHFARVNQNAAGLERIENGTDAGKIKFSFANLLHIHQPLVIMDEAHNARTSLTFGVLARVSPACIIEFTATPDLSKQSGSNVLCTVSATEVKAEEMIKLPIILTEHKNWQEALHDTVLTRIKLEAHAAGEADFVRPIALIQAESKDKEITVEVVKQHLIENEKIAPERIAIATGSQRELDGINLLDPKCQIEYVITIEALKEGWDCPFAYVFCSVATVHSSRDVEQILGRVLRMPYAKRRKADELNRAYAHVAALSFAEAAKGLHDRLVDMGFEEPEIAAYLEPGQRSFLDDTETPLFTYQTPDPLVLIVSEELNFEGFDATETSSVQVEQQPSGNFAVSVHGTITDALEEKLVAAVPQAQKKQVRELVRTHRQYQARTLTPAERGERLTVPNLCAVVQGELALADKESLLDANGWNLLDHSSELTDAEFAISETAHSFEIDINGNKVVYGLIDEKKQLPLADVHTAWTEGDLVRWLDKQVRQRDVRQEVMLEFVRRSVAYLIGGRGLSLASLNRFKYPLEKALLEKIRKNRAAAAASMYQEVLFGPSAAVQTTFELPTVFSLDTYAPRWPYAGHPYVFRKHFHPLIGELGNKGEEFDCAQVLDTLPQVKYWVRNIERTDNSFGLPTSTDKFYPDFVAQLEDGRILVIEYKGKIYMQIDDSKEKQQIGALWEEKSGGKGLFIMVEKKDAQGRDMRAQLIAKIGEK